MLRLLRQAIDPALPLGESIRRWYELSTHQREPPRQRQLQADDLRDRLKQK